MQSQSSRVLLVTKPGESALRFSDSIEIFLISEGAETVCTATKTAEAGHSRPAISL